MPLPKFLITEPVEYAFVEILFAASIYVFSIFRIEQIDNTLKATNKEIEEMQDVDKEILKEVIIQIRKLKKERRSMRISFTLFAALLVICAFVVAL